MNYKIATTDDFERQFKRLLKKYHSLKTDLADFVKELRLQPNIGVDLGHNTRKVRMSITSKNKGKSGGARIITYHLLINAENSTIYLLAIYDKSEQESISAQDIAYLKHQNGL